MFANLGIRADDSKELRLKKNLLAASSLLIGFLALFLGIMYLSLGRPLGAVIPASYTVLSIFSVTLFALTARYRLSIFCIWSRKNRRNCGTTCCPLRLLRR
jgi:hypothetical protein